MKRQKKQKIKNRNHPVPGSLARGGIRAPKNRRLSGESKRLPNLLLTIEPSHVELAEEALTRLRNFRVFGPYDLDGTALSINPLDVSAFLGMIERNSKTELVLYGLRRQAIEQLEARQLRCRSAHSLKIYGFLAAPRSWWKLARGKSPRSVNS